MSDKHTTKKFPVSFEKSGEPNSRSEFIIPSFSNHTKNVFIGLNSGKERSLGAVSFIGTMIDADDVISELQEEPENVVATKRIINEYIRQLKNFKIGNVISIQYNEDGTFVLKKEANRPKSKKKIKLP